MNDDGPVTFRLTTAEYSVFCLALGLATGVAENNGDEILVGNLNSLTLNLRQQFYAPETK